MGCWDGPLAAMVLLLLLPTLSAASFSDCFPSQQLERFWEKPSYAPGNPYIYRLFFADFYSFSFDNASQSLALENLSLAKPSEISAILPPQKAKLASAASSSLSQLHAHLGNATASQYRAHALSKPAQDAAATLFGPIDVTLFFLPNTGAMIAAYANTFLKAHSISTYMGAYPAEHASFLSSTAGIYDSANAAASSLAQGADEELAFLEKAGAGSVSYSGKAKSAYFEAQSFLSSQKCPSHKERATQIGQYSQSSPPIPDFASVGLPGYLQETVGTGNSSLHSLARFASRLSEAALAMQSEHSTSLLSAKTAISSLQGETDSLGQERLELIGDAPSFLSGGEGSLSVGGEFGGIHSGLLLARQELAESQRLLSEAQLSHSSKSADGYLASAIAQLELAGKKSQTAFSSLAQVRTSAQDAVAAQKEIAQTAISRAESALSAPLTSATDASASADARGFLEKAKQEFSLANGKRTLGERFISYSDAAKLAAEAVVRSESRAFLPQSNLARQKLTSLSSLISASEKDGLELEYERWKLDEYNKLLQSANSADAIGAISDAADADRQAILLRLAERYSYLEEKFTSASAAVLEIRGSKPSFLPGFERLSQYFPGGMLDVSLAAGKLSKMDAQLEQAGAEIQLAMPQHLSAILSANVRILESIEQPALGTQTAYSATISTMNTARFSYPSPVQFTAATTIQIYSSDQLSGDKLFDTYPENGKSILVLPSVDAGQSLSFTFGKTEQPAQITSSQYSCTGATAGQAEVEKEISFFTTRPLPSLSISEEVPSGTISGLAKYNGAAIPLQPQSNGNGGALLSGKLAGVSQGKHSLQISYAVSYPFSISQPDKAYEGIAPGAKKVSYVVSVSNPSLDCDSATASFAEPYSGISGFTVAPLASHQKVSGTRAIPSGPSTFLSFDFAPLRKDQPSKFALSFVIANESEAVSQALAQAELQAAFYNRSADAATVAQAKFLLSQNRTAEALSLLDKMGRQAASLSYNTADRTAYGRENASAQELLAKAIAAQGEISPVSPQGAAELSLATAAFRVSLESAESFAAADDSSKALSSARKASAGFRSSLSELAWKYSLEASDEYAQARKAGADARQLDSAQQQISDAQRLFTAGEHLASFTASAKARAALASLSDASSQQDASAASQAQKISDDFSSLRSKADSLLATYSSHYSSLTGASKKKLPFTPSQAQQKIDDAQKQLSAALKSKSGAAALLGANQSYAKLADASASLENAISSLAFSAESSLSVAKLALSEARQKALSEDESDLSQIASEVSRSEGFLANSLYADSLMSSDRAISAANTLLSKRSDAGLDGKSILLGLISLAFIGAAVYYFSFANKKSPPGGKKKIAKGEKES